MHYTPISPAEFHTIISKTAEAVLEEDEVMSALGTHVQMLENLGESFTAADSSPDVARQAVVSAFPARQGGMFMIWSDPKLQTTAIDLMRESADGKPMNPFDSFN